MKKFLLFVSLFSVCQLNAGDLERASTEDLLREVGRRIDSLGGGTGGSEAEVRFACDNYYLVVQVISATGQKQLSYQNPNASECNNQAAILKAKYKKFNGYLVVDVCDSYYKVTLKVLSSATIEKISSLQYPNYQACVKSLAQ